MTSHWQVAVSLHPPDMQEYVGEMISSLKINSFVDKRQEHMPEKKTVKHKRSTMMQSVKVLIKLMLVRCGLDRRDMAQIKKRN